jgi:hypothetical protein
MTLHVCVLGIDGSGKSTITAALPGILASEMNLLVGSAGDTYRISGPEEDHLDLKFNPEGMPLSVYLNGWFKRLAKRFVNSRRLYPVFKLSQLIFKDDAAIKLGERYRADLIISDGNALLSAVGRAANYLRPASDSNLQFAPETDSSDLKALLDYVLDGRQLTEESRDRLPRRLWQARLICRLTRLLGLRSLWLPDLVIFLDLSPKTALAHIASRSHSFDRHENEADLNQAREMYLKALEAYKQYHPSGLFYTIPVDEMSPGESLRAVVEAIRPHIPARQTEPARSREPLGTIRENLSGTAVWRRVLSYRYIVRYLLFKWSSGAWREPLFPFSNLGQLFLKEGYSANLMRAIYEQDEREYGMLDRIFLNYPLHRAVYDRLKILTTKIEAELEARLFEDREITIFTAPSGFSYDIFRPLESIIKREPEAALRIRLIAADLDPQNILADELYERAWRIGIDLRFLRGDITDDIMRRELQKLGPYDLILFVGLSSWLPKPQTVRHLQWARENMREGGTLITDSFTPEAYALSGRYAGYRANYYSPEIYKALADYCGFDGLRAKTVSGKNGINHVMTVPLREWKGENHKDTKNTKIIEMLDDSLRLSELFSQYLSE